MNEEQIKNFRWIGSHYSDLTKRFNNKWIAVIDERVAESGDSATVLKAKLEKKYKEDKEKLRSVVIELVTDKKFPEFDN
jgi:hypothetical protein